MMQLAAIFGALSIAATPAYATNMVVAWQQQPFGHSHLAAMQGAATRTDISWFRDLHD